MTFQRIFRCCVAVVIGASVTCSSGCSKFFNRGTWFDPSLVIRKPKHEQQPVQPIAELVGTADQREYLVPGATFPKPEDLEYSTEDYIIGQSDVLRIAVLDLYQEGQEAVLEKQVSLGGYIDMPLLERRVKASGLTQDELTAALKKAYQDAGVLKEATASVMVVGPRQNVFSILGAVNRPSQYPITRADFRLLEALCLAGDINQTNIEWLYVIRSRPKASPAGAKPSVPEAGRGPAETAEPPGKTPPPSGQTQPGTRQVGSQPTLEEQLRDLERLIPGASNQPRQTVPAKGVQPASPVRPAWTGTDEVAYMSSLDQAPTSQASPAQPATGPAAHVGSAKSAWTYVQGKGFVLPTPEQHAAPAEGATTEATASAPATSEGAGAAQATAGNAADPFGWARVSRPETMRIIAIHLPQLKAGNPRLNIIVRNNDIIQVPMLDYAEYYIGGEIARPGAFPMTGRQMTVKQAVVAASGFGPLSWPANSVLVRRVGPGQEQFIPLDLNAVFASKADDFFIKPNDTILVGSHWSTPFLAVWRNAFRMTYGFGFIYDRNYSDREFEIPIFWPRPWYRPTTPRG